MYDPKLQAIRAALIELQGDIKADSGPLGQTKIHVISTSLANAIARSDRSRDVASIADELQLQRELAAIEQDIIGEAASPADSSDLSESAFTHYLRDKVGGTVEVTGVRKLVGGASKQTIILTLKDGGPLGDQIVVRRDVPDGPVESEAADEFEITQQLNRRGLAVAEPLWADRSPPFGGTCMVTRFVQGEQAMDLTDPTARSGGREASLALARVLASIHSVPLADLTVPPASTGGALQDRIRAMIDDYEQQWHARRVGGSPTIAAAVSWLRANIPTGDEISLVHGDASLRNLMVKDGRESALLDWELWHVGDHHEDIAYCQADVTPWLDWDEFLAEYHAHGGKLLDPATLAFWGMFGAFRNMVFATALEYSFATLERPPASANFMALVGGRPLKELAAQRLAALGGIATPGA